MQHTALIARLGSYFLPDSDLDLRERFYERLCLISAVAATVIVVPTNAVQNLPPFISAAVLAFSLASLGFYIAARRGHRYPALFLFCLLLTMNAVWFPNAGTFGSAPLYWVIPIYYAVVFFTGRRRALVLAAVILNVVALMSLEYARPELVRMFERRQDRYIDLTAGFVVSTASRC